MSDLEIKMANFHDLPIFDSKKYTKMILVKFLLIFIFFSQKENLVNGFKTYKKGELNFISYLY